MGSSAWTGGATKKLDTQKRATVRIRFTRHKVLLSADVAYHPD
jgi:hypothetical protein